MQTQQCAFVNVMKFAFISPIMRFILKVFNQYSISIEHINNHTVHVYISDTIRTNFHR